MLIDDLWEQDIRLRNKRIRDAIVFRINERANDFGASHVRDELEPLPSPLPYNNMVIQFEGFCVWYFIEEISPQAKQYVVLGSFFSGIIGSSFFKNYVNKMPRIVFCSYINKKSYHCEGMNAFYPHTEQFEFGDDATDFSGDRATEIAELTSNSYKYLQAFLLILSCKNIRTDLETPDDKIQKKRASKGKLPLVSYYVLKIQNSSSHSEDSSQKGLWSNRVHFCRGHMREYTAEAPMFGKIIGRFWTPPHVRGNKNKGIIMKDYEVNTGRITE